MSELLQALFDDWLTNDYPELRAPGGHSIEAHGDFKQALRSRVRSLEAENERIKTAVLGAGLPGEVRHASAGDIERAVASQQEWQDYERERAEEAEARIVELQAENERLRARAERAERWLTPSIRAELTDAPKLGDSK